MQFFPSDTLDLFGSPADYSSVLPFAAAGGKSYAYANKGQEGENNFSEIFSTNLQEYNDNNNAGIPAGFRSVKDDFATLKSSDLNTLGDILKKQGVSEKTIDTYMSQVNALYSSITLGNLTATSKLLGGRQKPTLNQQERVAFTALMNKLGFDAQEAQDLETMSFHGEGKQLLEAVKEKLGTNKISITLDDLALLYRAADLPGNTSLAILERFGDSEELELSQEMFDKFFGSAMAELTALADQVAKLQQALPGAIQEMLTARSQTKESASADNKSSRRAELQEIMACENATSFLEEDDDDNKAGGDKIIRAKSMAARVLDGDAQAQKTAVAGQPVAEEPAKSASPRENAFGLGENDNRAQMRTENKMQPELKAQPEVNAQLNNKSANGAEAQASAKSAQNGSEIPADGRTASAFADSRDNRGSSRNAGEQAFDQKGKDTSSTLDPRSTLASKVDTVSGAFFTNASPAENSSPAGQQVKTTLYHERIFDQVEKGIVRNLGEGSKQMVLRLDPPELGKLTLSLTVAHGEVKALIRTESAATTQVINEQLAQLKVSLEEQGFKVASLEVETKTPSHAGTDNWTGMDQHNQQREMQEQSRFLRLARTRSKEADVLAQSMQHTVQPASISASGLHIIA